MLIKDNFKRDGRLYFKGATYDGTDAEELLKQGLLCADELAEEPVVEVAEDEAPTPKEKPKGRPKDKKSN